MELSQNHAKMTCYNMMHVEANKRIAREVYETYKRPSNQLETEIYYGKTKPNTH